MKQKRRSGYLRITAFLLAFILMSNLAMPCFAAVLSNGLIVDDSKTIPTGSLVYDYDTIPEYMLKRRPESCIVRIAVFLQNNRH